MKVAPALLVLALTMSGCAQHTTAGSGPTRTGSPSGVTSASRTDADNERDTAAAADRLIAAMAPPAGSATLPHAPAGWPPTIGHVPGQYVRTRWFTVRGSVADLVDFLHAHPPGGLLRDEGSSMSTGDGATIYEVDYRDPHATDSMSAMTAPQVRVSWQAAENGVVLQYQVALYARHARPAASLVRTPVSRVVLDRVPAPDDSGFPQPRRLHRLLTDPSRVAHLVAVANGLAASTITVLALPCPFAPPTAYTIRFTDAAGTLVLHWIPTCDGQVTAIRNGHDVGVTLDPGRNPSLLDAFNGAVR